MLRLQEPLERDYMIYLILDNVIYSLKTGVVTPLKILGKIATDSMIKKSAGSPISSLIVLLAPKFHISTPLYRKRPVERLPPLFQAGASTWTRGDFRSQYRDSIKII